ncbi:hypothetical protein BJV77DRAFT_963140 [Russula vinacea]|nr:hypothetical protein BJV77DRAFT_963140 [Russula vinacea]
MDVLGSRTVPYLVLGMIFTLGNLCQTQRERQWAEVVAAHPIRAPSLERLSRRPWPDRGPTSDTLLATPLPPVTASGSRTPSPLVVTLGIVDSFHQGPLGGVVALSVKVSDYVGVRGGKMECTFLYKPAQTLGTATKPNITKPQSISYLNSRMPTMKPTIQLKGISGSFSTLHFGVLACRSAPKVSNGAVNGVTASPLLELDAVPFRNACQSTSGLGARESDLPNRAAPVSLGWQRRKRAQRSLGSSEGGGRRDWRLRGEESEGNATEMRGIGQELTEYWGNY